MTEILLIIGKAAFWFLLVVECCCIVGVLASFKHPYWLRNWWYSHKQRSEAKAAAMLVDWLTSKQNEDLAKFSYFQVKGNVSGRTYTIMVGGPANIFFDGGRMCLVTAKDLPMGDLLLAQKIALETDEVNAVLTAQKWFKREHAAAAASRQMMENLVDNNHRA